MKDERLNTENLSAISYHLSSIPKSKGWKPLSINFETPSNAFPAIFQRS
ncbi:MAG: hypothetical protein LH472_16075 [Pyrinomonadaceae bacterium]|nr:hypothetical protein [Pyrinomonadaceae bacterium]